MKYSFFIASVGLVLSTTMISSEQSSDKVYSEVMSYIYEKMKNDPVMRRNTAHLTCYNEFLPLLNSVAIQAQNTSNECMHNATGKYVVNLLDLEASRSEVVLDVAKVEKFLTDCGVYKEIYHGEDYLNCLAGNMDYNIVTMERIKKNSLDILDKYLRRKNEISEEKMTCHTNAVEKAKAETDELYDKLHFCLTNNTINN